MDPTKSCDICQNGLSSKTADKHCTDCQQAMCASCVEMHQKFNTTKVHNLAPVNNTAVNNVLPDKPNVNTIKGSEQETPVKIQSGSQPVPTTSFLLCSIHDQPLEFYCIHDQEPVCKTCKLIEHRKCDKFVELSEQATNEVKIVPDILESVQVLKNELFKVKKAKMFARENLGMKKQQVLEQLQHLRQKFEILENNTLNELEQTYDKNAKELERDTDTLSQTEELVDQLKNRIKTLEQTGTCEEQFVASKAAERELKKYSEVLTDTCTVTLTDIHLTPNNYWKQAESLGDIDEEQVSQKVSLRKFSSLDFDLKTDTDKEDVFIIALDVLTDGRKLALDLTNNKLKLFSPNDKFLSEVDCPEEVHDLVLLNDSVALVTIPSMQENSLHKISIIDDTLSIDGPVSVLNTKPGLVTKMDENTFLAVSIKDNKIYLMVADQNGSIQNAMNSASGIKKFIKKPITAKMSPDRSKIYILDFYNGCITVDLSLMKVMVSKQLLYEFYGGLAIAPDGHVYLECGRKENDQKCSNILQLTADGQVVKKLFQTDISPRIIPLKIVGHKMYVFTKNTEQKMVLGTLHYKLM